MSALELTDDGAACYEAGMPVDARYPFLVLVSLLAACGDSGDTTTSTATTTSGSTTDVTTGAPAELGELCMVGKNSCTAGLSCEVEDILTDVCGVCSLSFCNTDADCVTTMGDTAKCVFVEIGSYNRCIWTCSDSACPASLECTEVGCFPDC